MDAPKVHDEGLITVSHTYPKIESLSELEGQILWDDWEEALTGSSASLADVPVL